MDAGPVGSHVDDHPLVFGGGSEDLVGSYARDWVTVIRVLPHAVGVMDDQFQGSMRLAVVH